MISGASLMLFGALTVLVSVLFDMGSGDAMGFLALLNSNRGVVDNYVRDKPSIVHVPDVCEHILPFSKHRHFRISKDISRVDESDASLAHLIDRREPFLLTHSSSAVDLVSSWNEYLLNRLSIMFGETFQSGGSLALVRKPKNYQYSVIDPSLSMDDSLTSLLGTDVTSTLDMTLDQFMFHNATKCRRNIYSANYRVLEGIYEVRKAMKTPKGAFVPWSDFIVEEPLAVQANLTVNNTPPIINVASSYWSDLQLVDGARSVTALQAHYSEFHRMVLQLQGSSSYYLSHPKYSKYMYMFPSNHPFHRYSQVSVEAPGPEGENEFEEEEDFPLFKKAKFRSVTLSAGEVLYIPPYWMSRIEVVSADDSVVTDRDRDPSLHPTEREFAIAKQLHSFLEVESASLEQLVLLEAMHTPFPQFVSGVRNEKLNPMQRMVCGQVLIMHLLSRLDGLVGASPRKFINQLIEQRYTSNTLLRLPDSLFVHQLQDSLDCMQAHPKEHEKLIQTMDYQVIVRFVKHLANCFSDPVLNKVSNKRTKTTVDGIQLVALHDFIEKVGLWSMQDSRSYNKQSSPLYNVVVFLQQCFQFESMIPITDDEETEEVLGTSIKVVSDPEEDSELDLDLF